MASYNRGRILLIVGMPLNKTELPSLETLKFIKNSNLIIGESRNVTLRRMNKIDVEMFFLDNIRKDEKENLYRKLRNLNSGGIVCLFSDAGMPGLFDTGMDVIKLCVDLNYKIKTLPGPTSWATACAISCFKPPFLILGFLSRKTEEREKELKKYSTYRENIVIMDTPYRISSLLTHIIRVFGKARKAFLAMEIGKENECYLWDTLEGLLSRVKEIKKEEFILIIEGKSSSCV